ncbi:hypothetical protein [Actinoplanes sp. URMC 104]|uniref:hypothetical protein n=1 Tax=Actinoplanes sp. URMC 104 TaxID=3423409 RepID=UPI003F1D418E
MCGPFARTLAITSGTATHLQGVHHDPPEFRSERRFLLTAAVVLAARTRLGPARRRGHRPVRRATRPHPWLPTARAMTAVGLALLALFAAAYGAAGQG